VNTKTLVVLLLAITGGFLASLLFGIPVVLPSPEQTVIPNIAWVDEGHNRLYVGYSNGRVGVWNIATGVLERLIFEPGQQAPVYSLEISGDGLYLATGDQDGVLRIWTLKPNIDPYGDFIRENTAIWGLTFSEDDRYVFTGNADGRLRRWDVASKILENVYTRHRRTINSAVFSPDGAYLATGASDNAVILWNVQKGEIEKDLKFHTDWVTSLAFTPNSEFLVSGGTDKTVKLWAVPQGYLLRDIDVFDSEVWSVCFKNNAEMIVGEASGDLSLWNVETAKQIRRVPAAHIGGIRSISYAPKTNLFFSSANDGLVRIWDGETLNLIATLVLSAHSEWLGYMPMGKYVSSDNALSRGDFYVQDGKSQFPIENYLDFLVKVPYLPIGDIFGPQIALEDPIITPRDHELTFHLLDDSLLDSASEGEQQETFNQFRADFVVEFDIWERKRDTVSVRAQDTFGNESEETFQVQFEGFRFYLKEAFQDLQKNALLSLEGIDGDDFLVAFNHTKYRIPKSLLQLTPYSPEIVVERLKPLPAEGSRTEMDRATFSLRISDILGVEALSLGPEHFVHYADPVKNLQLNREFPLSFGENLFTVVATNAEGMASSQQFSIVRVEYSPPQIQLSAVLAQMPTGEFPLSFQVSDDFLVDKVRLNGQERLVGQKQATIDWPVPITLGANTFSITALDHFHNKAQATVEIQGYAPLFSAADGVAVRADNGTIVHVLMKGDELTAHGQDNLRYWVRIPGGGEGWVSKREVVASPPDMFAPGLMDVRAQLREASILVMGIAYDDVQVAKISVGGQRVDSLRPVQVSPWNYLARDAVFFQLELLYQGEELFPLEVRVADGVGNEVTQHVIPRP